MRKAGNLKSENSQDYAQNRNLNEIVCSWIRLLVDSSGVVPFREIENSSSTEMKLETAFIEEISSSCVHVRYRNTEFFARTLLQLPWVLWTFHPGRGQHSAGWVQATPPVRGPTSSPHMLCTYFCIFAYSCALLKIHQLAQDRTSRLTEKG